MIKHHTHCTTDGKIINQIHELYQSRKVNVMPYICVIEVSFFPLPAVFLLYFETVVFFFIFILLYKRKWMIYEVFRNNNEHRKMRAKQKHGCKEMNQYTNNTKRKWFLSFSIKWTIGGNDRK